MSADTGRATTVKVLIRSWSSTSTRSTALRANRAVRTRPAKPTGAPLELTANPIERDQLVSLAPNPAGKRAPFVALASLGGSRAASVGGEAFRKRSAEVTVSGSDPAGAAAGLIP
jgi:hypothetical protein